MQLLEPRQMLAGDYVPTTPADWLDANNRESLLESYRPAPMVGHGEGESTTPIRSATLTVRVQDVDFNCNSSTCERDELYFNGTRLTSPGQYLTGADDQWSTVTFDVDPSLIVSGANEILIIIDVLGGGWCLEADWGQLRVTREDGSVDDYRTTNDPDLDLYQPCNGGDNRIEFEIDVYDIEVKDIMATDDVDMRGINDLVYDRATSSRQPIADNMIDSGFFGFGGGPGAFTVTPQFESVGSSFPNETFKVEYAYSIVGSAQTGNGQFSITPSDLTEDISIKVPSSIGQYKLRLEFEIKDSDGVVVSQPQVPELDLYVTYAEPETWWDPKKEWIEAGTKWASGATTDTQVAHGVLAGIYSQSGWRYRDVGFRSGGNTSTGDWTRLTGMGGSSPTPMGNCVTFSNAWQGLTRSLGLDTDVERTYGNTSSWNPFSKASFITKPSTSVGGEISGNAHPPGATPDRWLFGMHQVGYYAGTFFDPTFGKTWTGALHDFIEWFDSGVGGTDAIGPYAVVGNQRVYDTGISPAHGWGDYLYRPNASPEFIEAQPVAADGEWIASTETDYAGHDIDGDGIYDQLVFRWDMEVDTPGTYAVTGSLSARGTRITNRATYNNSLENTVLLEAATPGTYRLDFAFSGEDIYYRAMDGNYQATFTVVSPEQSTSTFEIQAAGIDHTQFGESDIDLVSVVATGVSLDADGQFDVLRISAEVFSRTATAGAIQAKVFSLDGDFLADVGSSVELAAGNQTVVLDLESSPLLRSGIDGPYTVQVHVYDSSFVQVDRSAALTESFESADFDSEATISTDIQTEAVDTNNNSFADKLDVTLSIDVQTVGTYTVKASLYADDGTLIQTISKEETFAAGRNEITLSFDGRAIADHGSGGPYQVRYVSIGKETTFDIVEDAATTDTLMPEDFEPASTLPIDFTGVFSHALVDDNADDIVDRLVIYTQVMVGQSGSYELNGRLLDGEGGEIDFQGTTVTLDEGETVDVALSFSSQSIIDNGVDGPFVLTDLSIYPVSGSGQTAFRLDAYSTDAYIVADFQAKPHRIYPPMRITGPHSIPGDGLVTALMFKAIEDTTLAIVPIGVSSLREFAQVIDQDLQPTHEFQRGIITARVSEGEYYAIVFEPSQIDSLYYVYSSNGEDAMSANVSTNFLLHTDTNFDGITSPSDALRVINYLSLNADGGEGESPILSTRFLDVNMDGKVSPLDALTVINRIALEQGEGELTLETESSFLDEDSERCRLKDARSIVGLNEFYNSPPIDREVGRAVHQVQLPADEIDSAAPWIGQPRDDDADIQMDIALLELLVDSTSGIE
ncbi:DUF4785 family immunoglobulin-like domain-containing protein [Stieleria maiorica]|uniref:DUF4785 family immunoglobulin-like domain-containing protein n=1 Tax=Stieleria maiorica TaxID=2795974 RepID=UPI0011CA8724|nr:dockerin type I domain-containing protein [Stieleria maiorica]